MFLTFLTKERFYILICLILVTVLFLLVKPILSSNSKIRPYFDKKTETFENSVRSVLFLTVAAMVAFYSISLCICS